MDPFAGEGHGAANLARSVAFVASAALAALALRIAWDRPAVGGAVLAGAFTVLVLRWLAERRLRRVLRSGNIESILARWSRSIARMPHPATMAPLMTATAFAAYGRVDEARAALDAAERGPAWEAAIEHRLFLDSLLLTFEGDRDGALERAGRLVRLPIPPVGQAIQRRIVLLRGAVAALARAFAHKAEPGDMALLERGSETSPLVFWAMRYAAAVLAIDSGELARARGFLAEAPNWPAESAFRAFHDEIAARAAA